MNILKYTYQGKDVTHDVHYAHEQKLLRFGANEDAPASMVTAKLELDKACSELAGVPVIVKNISFKAEIKEMTCTFKVLGAAQNGEHMKIELPKVGWRWGLQEKMGQFVEVSKPVGIDEDFMNTIKVFIECLEKYVQNGAGQLSFDFEDDGLRVVRN